MDLNVTGGNASCPIDTRVESVLVPILYMLVLVVSLPGNCLSIYVALQRRTELGVYLFNLSLADLLYTLTLPLWIDFSLSDDNWRAGIVLCKICSFLTYTNLYASAGFLCCISFVRFLGVVYPLRFLQIRTVRAAVVISLVVWVFQSATHVLLLIKDETYIDDNMHVLCYDIYPLERWKAHLNYVHVAFGFVFPLVLLLAFHRGICNAIRGNRATRAHEKRRAKKLMLSITLSFVLCFAPYHAVLLVRSVREPDDCCFARSIFKAYKLSVALTTLNCLSDPVLYCFVSESVRDDMLPFSFLLGRRRKPKLAARTGLGAILAPQKDITAREAPLIVLKIC
uniref:G-protein coupled receptor 4-like n=1 Tax=Callorhinchus milii TaxID=7868 RepID=A0A4W3J713_CALMI